MTSQQLPDTWQHTPTPQLNAHLNGIREEFERLNQELHKARKQRDEYRTNYSSQAKELRELRQIVSRCRTSEDHVICRNCKGEIISPASSSSEYHSAVDSERQDATQDDEGGDIREADIFTGKEDRIVPASLSHDSDGICTNEPRGFDWDMTSTGGVETALKLNLVHNLTQEGRVIAAFSMDGKYLATASSIGIVCIFDVQTGKRISAMSDLYDTPDERHSDSYRCLCFSPDGKYLATGGTDCKIRIWIISRRGVKSIFRNDGNINDLHFSPDGQSIVTTSSHAAGATIWRLRDGFSRVLTGADHGVWAVRFSRDGRYIVSGAYSGLMNIWTVRRGKLVARIQTHQDGVSSLRFTPDGKGLLSASADKTVIHWDVTSLSSLGMHEGDPTTVSSVMEISRLAGHTANVYAISISPDGKWIASGSWDDTVRIWNVHDATLQGVLNCKDCESIWSVDFSPIGNYLAIADGTGKVTIWNYAYKVVSR